jgi:CheY-like chemotaxis protein
MFDALKRGMQEKTVARGPRRVLVVDDEESVRRFVARVLDRGGHRLVQAEDGPRALAIAETEGPFDLLVTDLMMPNMNGDELARRMRQIQPGLKVLYLTGFSDKLFKEKVTLWQDEAFLDKPCSIKGLLEAVSLLTDGRIDTPPAQA